MHCAFTAAVIFLLDATSANEQTHKRAIEGFKVCFGSLKDMEITWSWSSRSVLALRNLARGWKVDISGIEASFTPPDINQPTEAGLLLDAGDEESIFGQFMEPLPDMPHETLSSALDWSSLYPFAEGDDVTCVFHHQ